MVRKCLGGCGADLTGEWHTRVRCEPCSIAHRRASAKARDPKVAAARHRLRFQTDAAYRERRRAARRAKREQYKRESAALSARILAERAARGTDAR
jgi:hypothetical protein